MSYDLPILDANQLDLVRSPYMEFYIKFSLLHLNEDAETIERESLNTFYATNTLPGKQVL